MDIKIKNYTIHYIDKEAKKTVAKIDYSKEVLSIDEFSITLVSEIHKSINESSTTKNTHFRENTSNEFTNTLNDYLSTSTKEDFYSFTKSLDDLKLKIEKEPLATGGYYVFVDYEIVNKRYISVVLLRKKSGINITKVGDVFKVNGTENINIDKIAMAFRLNYQIYQETGDDRNYIAFISTQKDGDVSGYFKDWVSAGGLIKNDKNTVNFVSIIKSIPLPKDEDGKEIFRSRGDFQKAVFDSVNVRKDKIINLKDLGKQFYGEDDENSFIDFGTSNNMIIDSEFKRDSEKWRTLVTIRAYIPGIEINVDYNKINSEEFSTNGEVLTIKSKLLVDQIVKQYGNR